MLRQRAEVQHSVTNQDFKDLEECGEDEGAAMDLPQNAGQMPDVTFGGGQVAKAEFRREEVDGNPKRWGRLVRKEGLPEIDNPSSRK